MFFLEESNPYESMDMNYLHESIVEDIYQYESEKRDIIMEGILLELQVDKRKIKDTLKLWITKLINMLKTVFSKISALIKSAANNSSAVMSVIGSRDEVVEIEGLFVENESNALIVNVQRLTGLMAEAPRYISAAYNEYKKDNNDTNNEPMSKLEEFKNKVDEYRKTVGKAGKPISVQMNQAYKTLATIKNSVLRFNSEVNRYNRIFQTECTQLSSLMNKDENLANQKFKYVQKLASVFSHIESTLSGMAVSVINDGKRVSKGNKKVRKIEDKQAKKNKKMMKKATNLKKKKVLFTGK